METAPISQIKQNLNWIKLKVILNIYIFTYANLKFDASH